MPADREGLGHWFVVSLSGHGSSQAEQALRESQPAEPEPSPPPPQPDYLEWVPWQDDTSIPTEEELKEVEGTEESALDVPSIETNGMQLKECETDPL